MSIPNFTLELPMLLAGSTQEHPFSILDSILEMFVSIPNYKVQWHMFISNFTVEVLVSFPDSTLELFVFSSEYKTVCVDSKFPTRLFIFIPNSTLELFAFVLDSTLHTRTVCTRTGFDIGIQDKRRKFSNAFLHFSVLIPSGLEPQMNAPAQSILVKILCSSILNFDILILSRARGLPPNGSQLIKQ